MRIREVAGCLVVSLPIKLCQNFDIKEGDLATPIFSKGRIVLEISKCSEEQKIEKPKKQGKICPYCKKRYELEDIDNHVNNWCELNPNIKHDQND